jgi:hypothetical protein
MSAITTEGLIYELLNGALEGGDTFKTRNQDQTTPPFQYYLMRHLNENVQLANPISVDDTTIDLVAGHGFVVGNYIVIWENSAFEQARVTNVAVNTITVEIPVANAFTTSAKVIRGTIDMNINGSGGVQFEFTPFQLQLPIDIETVMITMQSGANVPDDGKFGGIAQLTTGVYFRLENGQRTNLGNYRDNKSFRDRGATIEYTAKAPAGTNGTNILFDIKEALGVVLRVGEQDGDRIIGVLRDNLSTLAGMTVSLLGQYTLAE